MSETKCANCGEFPDDGLYTGDDGREFCSSACELTYTRRRDAAPDLYEALAELVERRDRACQDHGGNRDGSDGRYARARAALARARGEETP